MRRVDLWGRVDKRGPDDCWPWQGPCLPKGYGFFRGTTAHRLVYAGTNGPIPAGLVVLHSCDNPPCCNPRHLTAGTQKQNLDDMRAKGRQGDTRNFGVANGFAKLTDEQVAEVRRLRRGGMVQQRIADLFGIGQTHVSRIVRGEVRTQNAAAA